MGSNNSQPTQSQARPAPRRLPSNDPREQSNPQDAGFENPPPLIYLHEKYEELTYNIVGVLDKPTHTVSPSDLFYIAVSYPYYCQSTHDMIRQAIRAESVQATREQPDYLKNFQFSENMDYSRIKVIERCKYRHKYFSSLNNTTSSPIIYKETNDDDELIIPDEINFGQILIMLRNVWSKHNRHIITNLISNFKELTGTPIENYTQIDTILPILSQLMGNDACDAFIPHRNLIWSEIDSEFESLKSLLSKSKPRCCMNFSPTEPLHSFEIEGLVVPHGICSNGKFLFILTNNKILSIHLIYKGMIYRTITKYNLPENWQINNDSFLFCSQRWLFLKDKNKTYQFSISQLVCEDSFQFKLCDRFGNIDKACSNGATYSVISNDEALLIFDADSDKLILKNENVMLISEISEFNNNRPMITNGMFIASLLRNKMQIYSTYLHENPIGYIRDDCFPKDNNMNVEAVTLDILSNVYFSVIYDNNKSVIYSHPYSGAPDSFLFGLKLTSSLDNDLFESILLKYLLPCAFSPTIPDNMIANSNSFETDLKGIVIWIEKFRQNVNLIKALILLIDINFQKYESKEVAQLLVPLIKTMILTPEYKRLISALVINHFDLFFDEIGFIEFGILFNIMLHLPNQNGGIFNEWALNKLSQSSLLSKIVLNEEFIIGLFTDKWLYTSRDEEIYSWGVDILLVAQQNSFEEAVQIVEKDPLNLNESELVTSLCSYAKFLVEQFVKVIEKVINDNPNKQDRKLDYDSILYTLISNFFASAAPITGCIQFANIITNADAQKIIRLLNNEFEIDDTLQLFIGYFDMIYTTSISSLIRGGSFYPCEDDYKWLIHNNFNSGNRDLTPPELNQARFFLSSLDNKDIKDSSENLPYFYDNLIENFKPRKEYAFVDPFIMAAFIHQTNTSNLLSIRINDNENNNNNIEVLKSICRWVKKMRFRFISLHRTNKQQADKFIANLGILILLDPVLTDFMNKPSERDECFQLLEQFIKNNDPYQFHKVLKAIPTRIDNVLNGLYELNCLFQTIQNPTFHQIIIDGISRVDSFERLGYLLSHAELDQRALDTIEIFNITCISLLQDFHQISILEILYTVLAACKNFNEKAIEVMNELSNHINNDNILSDPYFMTVAGLAASTSAIPEIFSLFPKLAKACIIQLIFSKEDAPTLTVDDLFSYIFNQKSENNYKNPLWIKMLFTIFIKCEDDEQRTLNTLMLSIFEDVSNCLNKNCLVFSTLPDIIYGFRAILNSGNKLSINLQTRMALITTDSPVGEIFLLFAIIAGDISDYSMFYSVRNRHGKWLKYSNNNNNEDDYYIRIPISPLNKREKIDSNEITDPVQDVELDLKNGLSFDTILAYWDVCMKDHEGSILCRLYLQTLTKYILTTNEKLSKENLSFIAKTAKPYIDFHILSSNQTKIYKSLSDSFNSTSKLLQEHENGLGVIEQKEWTHLFAFNVMHHGNISMNAIILGDGFIVIHNQEPIFIQVPSGVYNGSQNPIQIENGIIQININGNQLSININETQFKADKNTSIEFIFHSIENILFDMNQYDFTNSQICITNADNLNVEYKDDIFEDENHMEEFNDDITSVQPVKFKLINQQTIDRTGKNIRYNQMIEEHCFNDKLPFNGSASMNLILSRKNEFNICNQFKSVILAQAAIKDPQSLDWATSFSLIKSAVVAVGGFNKQMLFENKFPYSLEKGFFMSCSMNFIQSSNVQIFFIAIKALIKSEQFMNNLGKNLVIMAQDLNYHSLVNKKDFVFILPEDFETFKHDPEKDYIIKISDQLKGKIEIDDSGFWLIDTPMVLLLLLWIFIDNCTTSVQRTCAKLAIVDCMLIQSPMINKFMPEFLTYMQSKLLFMPDDFNPVYIHHLSTLALRNPNNPQIINFYECEKNCFNQRTIQRQLNSESFNFDEIEEVDLHSTFKDILPAKMTEIIQLMKKYKSVNDFPIWNFLPIWKTISSVTYEKYSDDKDEGVCVRENNHVDTFNPLDTPLLYSFKITSKVNQDEEEENEDEEEDIEIEIYDYDDLSNVYYNIDIIKQYENIYFGYNILKPNERQRIVWKCKANDKVEIQIYKITNNKLTQNTLINDIKSFCVDWNESDTEELLLECSSFYFKCTTFMLILFDSLNMTHLIQKHGIHVVQCKLYCLYMFNAFYKVLSQNEEEDEDEDEDDVDKEKEIRRLGHKYSNLFSYQSRIEQFNIMASFFYKDIAFLASLLEIPIILNDKSALKFINGESNDYCDSMIYQLSEAIKQNNDLGRFRNIVWNIKFKGSEAIDITGVTNQTITLSINSFLFLKTGLCIISPNFTQNTPNSETVDPTNMDDILIIPYPNNKDDVHIENMLFSFGICLGSMIRGGLSQDIPFPLFIWNFLAGKQITKDDVYENDTRLRDQIKDMKEGKLNDQNWTYRDWNNVIKPIVGFPEDKIVSHDLVDVYETVVIDLRIKSLVQNLSIIKNGLWENQEITIPNLLSGGLISFLCQGKKTIDIQELIKRIIFKNDDENLQNNFKTILNEYDQQMISKFIMFTTAKQRPPNFTVVPDYFIIVEFNDHLNVSGLPVASTCFNLIKIPMYPNLDIMREKLNYAIRNCIGMDIK